MAVTDDEVLQPPCLYCDEPCATDPQGQPYDWCFAHLLEWAEPTERREDPDAAHDARVSRQLDERGAA